MNPRGQGVDDDLANLGLILIAAVGVLAAILRLAGSVAAFASGTAQPRGGWEAGFRVISHPGDPATALAADGLAAWIYWLVLALMVAAVVASALVLWRRIGSIKAQDHARPPPPGRRCDCSRRTVCGLAEGTAVARPDIAAVARQARSVRHRLPARPLPWSGCVGIRRGLDPPARPTAVRQGLARRHQRDPRRTRRGHHHRDPARQHRRHPYRPPRTRSGRRLRPATPGRGSARWPSLVTRAGLRRPAHRDDPRHRPRIGHRPVDRRRRVRRILGRQDQNRPPSPAPRCRTRRPFPPRAVRLDPRTLGCSRRGRDLVEQPQGCIRLGRLPGVDDPL